MNQSSSQELQPYLSRVTQAAILLADWLVRVQKGRNIDEMKIVDINIKLANAKFKKSK